LDAYDLRNSSGSLAIFAAIRLASSPPTLTLNGMPASPHQIAVIRPQTKQHIAEASTRAI
jgi:hypothetical protein